MHPTFSTRGHRPKSHVTNPPGRRLCIAHTPALLKRPGITGARWGLDGAEAVLKLRALISNGDLDAYWRICGNWHISHYARWQIMSGWQVCGLFGLVWLSVTDEWRNIIGRLREALGTGRDPGNGGLTDERPEAGRDDRPAQRVP